MNNKAQAELIVPLAGYRVHSSVEQRPLTGERELIFLIVENRGTDDQKFSIIEGNGFKND